MVFGTRSKLIRFVWASFLSFVTQLAGTAAYAQSTGEIRLQVKDPSGAALQASGHVAGPTTDRAFRTDAQGAFSLSGLAFGQRIEGSSFWAILSSQGEVTGWRWIPEKGINECPRLTI
jgi:hypothetical protein